MSNVSNTHTFQVLDKDSKPLSGQRLIRLIAKSDRDGKYKSENLTSSMCVSVPYVTDTEVIDVIDKLIPHVIALVQDTQDKLAREFRIQYGRNELPQAAIGMDAVIAYLGESAAGDRVTKEYLQEWFISTYATIAADWITAVAGGNISSDVVEKKVSVLCDMFAGWASPKYSPNIPQLRAMIRFTQHTDMSSDSRMQMMSEKCHKMLAKKESELSSDALGF